MILKALSLLQPWASLVAIGAKRIETRSWLTLYRGPLVICASRAWTNEARALFYRAPFCQVLLPHFTEHWQMPVGRAVCLVDLVGCYRIHDDPDLQFSQICREQWQRERTFGDFAEDRFAWALANVRRWAEPFAVRGQLGLFNLDVPDDLLPPDLSRQAAQAQEAAG